LGGVRSKTFWSIDYIRGRRIARHINDIKECLANPDKANEQVELRTGNLLDHACATTNWYQRLKGHNLLSDFPVIDKDTVRRNYSDFFSSAFDKSNLIPVTTSGSYGTPFTFYLSKEKKARQLAEIIFFGEWAGYEIGMKHAYVRVTNKKGAIILFIQNEVLMNPTVMDTEWLARQRSLLLNDDIKVIIGYPSSIGAIATYCSSKGDKPDTFHLRGVISSAQPLSERDREKIQEVFGCNVLSRYSTEELGVLAQECVTKQRHHMNVASYVIEVLALDADTPVGPGQLGRVVVTDLFSHAMPLIRYDIGDLATIGPGCSCGINTPVLERIEGRMIEMIYDTKGRQISPFSINGAMRDLDDILQFQFIQKSSNEYCIKLRVLESFKRDISEKTILGRMLKILGRDSVIQIQYVEDIPSLPSGKRPYIINEIGLR